MSRYEKILEVIREMDDCSLVSLHNSYCDATNGWDNSVYSIEDFDEIMNGKEPWEIARCAFFGEFNPTHDWFWFNGYGNLESTDYADGLPIYPEDIAEYVDRTENALDNDDIQEILDELEDAC